MAADVGQCGEALGMNTAGVLGIAAGIVIEAEEECDWTGTLPQAPQLCEAQKPEWTRGVSV